jgi:hypothetical protein
MVCMQLRYNCKSNYKKITSAVMSNCMQTCNYELITWFTDFVNKQKTWKLEKKLISLCWREQARYCWSSPSPNTNRVPNWSSHINAASNGVDFVPLEPIVFRNRVLEFSARPSKCELSFHSCPFVFLSVCLPFPLSAFLFVNKSGKLYANAFLFPCGNFTTQGFKKFECCLVKDFNQSSGRK